MKTWKKVAIIAGVVTTTAIALSSCEKPPVDEPKDPYEDAKKECALKEEHKSDPDSVYMWQGNKCIGVYNGVVEKDTTLLWNADFGTMGGEASGGKI